MKTAIIDNGIDVKTLSRYANQPLNFVVSEGKVVPSTSPLEITHGGLCTRVFAGQAEMLPDVSICLLNDDTHRSNVHDLITALEWCANNEITLVSLSMGTKHLEDCAILYKITKQLLRAGVVLVASASNENRLTYPAAFDSCIGVCQSDLSGIEAGRFVYCPCPVDGINVVTYPVYLPEFQIFGSNSLSTAFIAGLLCRNLAGAIDIDNAREWLTEQSQGVSAEWESVYIKEKIRPVDEYESINIACLSISAERTEMFMKELQKYITTDGYTCVILTEKNESNLPQHQFSLAKSPISPIRTLQFVTRLCQPGVTLFDSLELVCLADVIVYDETICCKSLFSHALLTCRLNDKKPVELWKKVFNLFEKGDASRVHSHERR